MSAILTDIKVFSSHITFDDHGMTTEHMIAVLGRCMRHTENRNHHEGVVLYLGPLAEFQNEFPHRMSKRLDDGEFVLPNKISCTSDFTRLINNRIGQAQPLSARAFLSFNIRHVSWPAAQIEKTVLADHPDTFMTEFFGMKRIGLPITDDDSAARVAATTLTIKRNQSAQSLSRKVWFGVPKVDEPTTPTPNIAHVVVTASALFNR